MTTSPQKRQYYFSVGKRKTSIARVRIFEGGSGTVLVNGKKLADYFPSGIYSEKASAPLSVTESKNLFDIEVGVNGGGKSSQADAIRHGISRALVLFNPEFRLALKREGFLRRDARIKERKKPGLKRARKAPTYTKR